MFFIVSDLEKRETVPIRYDDKEDAKSMAKILNETGMGNWIVLVTGQKPQP